MRPRVGRVAVLGGGPAGLAAAHELCAGGVEVVVLERAPWVGGLSLTVEREGFRFDLGGHRWFTKQDWLHDWFLTLMQGELVRVRRVSRIYFDGSYFDYPIRIRSVLRSVGLQSSAHAMLSYGWRRIASALRPRPIETIEQAYVDQFGAKLYRMFFKRYTEKVWGRDCTQLSADWVAQRTKGLSVWQTLRDAVVGSRARVASLVDEFVYPELGYQRISERMREAIEARGGRVRLEAKVVGVEVRADGVVVRLRSRDGAEEEIACEHAISTIPLGQLARILTPAAPAAVLDAAKGLEFRSVITANIMLRKDQVTPDTWLYIHDPGIGFARIHEPRNWSSGMVPGPGRTSLCAEWFCSVGDEVWQQNDDEIVARTIAHLADDLGFIQRSEVIGGFALRARNAYPVYSLDYAERLHTIKQHLSSHRERLSIAGRGGTFRYNNADHSIEMGLLVARNLLGGDHDVDAVNAEPEYHEEKRLGD